MTEELTNDEKLSIERAFDLLIKEECDQVDYSELMKKLEVYKRK